MKKYLSLILFVAFSLFVNAQEIKPNEDNALELKEVVEVNGMTKDAIFTSVQSMLSDWSYNANSQNKIDYDDKESGVVITKGRLFLGYKKVGLVFGWNTYIDYSCTVRAKDNKYQVIIKVPSMYFKFDNTKENAEETAPITSVYPEYNYKSTYTIKKPAKEYAPLIPEAMKAMYQAICNKIKNSALSDDF